MQREEYSLSTMVKLLEEKARTAKAQTREIKTSLIGYNPEPCSDSGNGIASEPFEPSIKDILIKAIEHLNETIMNTEETLRDVNPDAMEKKSPKFGKMKAGSFDSGNYNNDVAKADHGDYY